MFVWRQGRLLLKTPGDQESLLVPASVHLMYRKPHITDSIGVRRLLQMSKVPCWQTCLLWKMGSSPRRRLGRQHLPPWRAWTQMKVAFLACCPDHEQFDFDTMQGAGQ